MAGTKAGGAKTKATTYLKYGQDFYKRIGQLGGSTKTDKPKGFAAMPKSHVSAAGRKGGTNSRRTK